MPSLTGVLSIPGAKLSEACQQQQFNRTVEDVERWLNDIESSLISEDYGKVRQGRWIPCGVFGFVR